MGMAYCCSNLIRSYYNSHSFKVKGQNCSVLIKKGTKKSKWRKKPHGIPERANRRDIKNEL